MDQSSSVPGGRHEGRTCDILLRSIMKDSHMSDSQDNSLTSSCQPIGLSLPASRWDAASGLRHAQKDGFDFVTTAVTTLPDAQTRLDILELRARWWKTSVVGLMDGVCDKGSFDFCHHMQLPAIIFPDLTTKTDDLHNYAAAVTAAAASSTATQYWISVPLSTEGLQHWQLFHRLTGFHSRVSISLGITPFPADIHAQNVSGLIAHELRLLHLFLGEPISAATLATDLFLTNKKGYPTLAKARQLILTHLLTRLGRTVKLLLVGPGRHSIASNTAALGATGCMPYLQYLRFLRQQAQVAAACDTPEARLETDYLDTLQRPLQPLADHLEYEIYENFEKDPVKYVAYERALYMALEDLLYYQKQDSATVFVVGAGRGPLVTAVFNAYETLIGSQSLLNSTNLRVVIVEKNPSAFTILQARAQGDSQWQRYMDDITFVLSDLRTLNRQSCGDQSADIAVSELLGSFGDNELSPECLDSFFNTSACRPDTISIPTRYTSYLSLVSSAKLHAQARQHALYPNEYETGILGIVKAMETPYVVRAHASSQMCPELECWSFEHPSPSPTHNREIVLSVEEAGANELGCGFGSGYGLVDKQFEAMTMSTTITPMAWTCTGLLGTFSAELYTGRNGQGTCRISIAPSSFSVGMFSWFPLYFPIMDPILVPSDASIRIYLWRRQNLELSKVWYEWSIAVHRKGEVVSATPVHNPGGRSYYVSMK